MDLPKGGSPASGSHKYEELKLKQCKFLGCSEHYMGTGFSKYCEEHRKKEYKPILMFMNKMAKVSVDNPNKIHDHTNKIVHEEEWGCDLCGKTYAVKIFPEVFIYPKYCELHRNEHKRNLYIKENNIVIKPVSNSGYVVSFDDNVNQGMMEISYELELVKDD